MTLNDENLEAMGLISRLLQADQPLFEAGEVQAFARDTGLDAPDAFHTLIAAACGLKPDENEHDRRLAQRYLFPAIRPLKPEAYAANPYYQLLQNAPGYGLPPASSSDTQRHHETPHLSASSSDQGLHDLQGRR